MSSLKLGLALATMIAAAGCYGTTGYLDYSYGVGYASPYYDDYYGAPYYRTYPYYVDPYYRYPYYRAPYYRSRYYRAPVYRAPYYRAPSYRAPSRTYHYYRDRGAPRYRDTPYRGTYRHQAPVRTVPRRR